MDQRLKERLIGAVVLVAVAVWLIPWLLDGPEREPASETVALQLPAADESAPVRTVSIDLDNRGRPAVAGGRDAEPARDEAESTSADARAAAVDREGRAAAEPATNDEGERVSAEPASASASAETSAENEPEQPAAGGGSEQPASASASAETSAENEPEQPAAGGGSEEPAVENASAEISAASVSAETSAESASAAGQDAPAGDWAVQLGSFSEAGNADRLAARIETFGYEPAVSAYTSGGRQMHRVRVGPQPSRARAEAVASALSAHGFVAQVVTAD